MHGTMQYVPELPRIEDMDYKELAYMVDEAKNAAIARTLDAGKDKTAMEEKTTMEQGENRAYKLVYYAQNERTELFAGDKESGLKQLRDIKEAGGYNDMKRCYIQRFDAKSGEYRQDGI